MSIETFDPATTYSHEVQHSTEQDTALIDQSIARGMGRAAFEAGMKPIFRPVEVNAVSPTEKGQDELESMSYMELGEQVAEADAEVNRLIDQALAAVEDPNTRSALMEQINAAKEKRDRLTRAQARALDDTSRNWGKEVAPEATPVNTSTAPAHDPLSLDQPVF